ncbi:hypothetical protein ACP4OV_005410 [Aristida adscensionis]
MMVGFTSSAPHKPPPPPRQKLLLPRSLLRAAPDSRRRRHGACQPLQSDKLAHILFCPFLTKAILMAAEHKGDSFCALTASFAKAKRYLEDVIAHKQASSGDTVEVLVALHKPSLLTQMCRVRWPVKSARFILELLKNAENPVLRVDVNNLHVQVNQIQKQRRRTYLVQGHMNRKS